MSLFLCLGLQYPMPPAFLGSILPPTRPIFICFPPPASPYLQIMLSLPSSQRVSMVGNTTLAGRSGDWRVATSDHRCPLRLLQYSQGTMADLLSPASSPSPVLGHKGTAPDRTRGLGGISAIRIRPTETGTVRPPGVFYYFCSHGIIIICTCPRYLYYEQYLYCGQGSQSPDGTGDSDSPLPSNVRVF